ncbi:hypothetical protein Tco_0089840 [Tanacetum coccineum]
MVLDQKPATVLLTMMKFQEEARQIDSKLRTSVDMQNLGFSVLTARLGACIKGMSETETSKGCSLSQGKDVMGKHKHEAEIQEVNPNQCDNSRPIFDDEGGRGRWGDQTGNNESTCDGGQGWEVELDDKVPSGGGKGHGQPGAQDDQDAALMILDRT